MKKVSFKKRIKDFLERLKLMGRMIYVATDKSINGKYIEEVKPEIAIVHQTTKVEPDIVVYSKEEIELKYVAIDKLFAMQEMFSKQEYFFIKQMVSDEEFLRIYFSDTNKALIDYLVILYSNGRFTKNILDAMSRLGMVVVEPADEIKFMNLDEYFANISIESQSFDLCEDKISYTNNKKS